MLTVQVWIEVLGGMLVDVRVDENVGWVLTVVRAHLQLRLGACRYACAFNFFLFVKVFVQGCMY